MRRGLLLGSAMALVVGVANLSAQATNFAGKWNMVPDTTQPAGRGGRGGLGMTVTIAQDAKTITITRTTQAGDSKAVYNLDGSESKNSVTQGGNTMDQVSHAKWDGAKLVITTTMNFNGTATDRPMTLSLDASGDMWVESPAGGRNAQPGATTKTHYKKGM